MSTRICLDLYVLCNERVETNWCYVGCRQRSVTNGPTVCRQLYTAHGPYSLWYLHRDWLVHLSFLNCYKTNDGIKLITIFATTLCPPILEPWPKYLLYGPFQENHRHEAVKMVSFTETERYNIMIVCWLQPMISRYGMRSFCWRKPRRKACPTSSLSCFWFDFIPRWVSCY